MAITLAATVMLVVISCTGGNGVPTQGGAGGDMATAPHPGSGTPTHRAAPPAACTPQAGGNCQSGMSGACGQDADCTAGLDGRCVITTGTTCACRYDACLTDDDCAAGTDCSCDAQRGGAGASGNPTVCVPSNCRTDADCGTRYCSPSIGRACGGVDGWYCHTADDECTTDADCPAGTAPDRGVCVYSHELAHWSCSTVPFCAG